MVLAFGRGDGSSAAAVAPPRGNVGACAALEGDPARGVLRPRGRSRAGRDRRTGTPNALARHGPSTTVTFDGADTSSAALLCDLHLRVGATDAEKAVLDELGRRR